MLTLKNLSFGYSPNSALFQNLDVSISSGHIYGLLGKNGAGKTSLLKNMLGLVYPQKGMVEFHGENVKNRSVKVLQDLYFIAEEPHFPSLSPIQFAKYNSSFYPQFSLEEFEINLEAFKVERTRSLHKQSYGQQKKALISFALAAKTSLLVLDEPTNGLDIPSKAQFRKLVASSLDKNKSIIISTHQVRDLENLLDTVLILDQKEIKVNASLDYITEKLVFKNSPEPIKVLGAYQEDSLIGKTTISPNMNGESSKVDLELLFNAVISENVLVLNALKIN